MHLEHGMFRKEEMGSKDLAHSGWRHHSPLRPRGRGAVDFTGFRNQHCKDTASPYAKLTNTFCRFVEYVNVGGNRSSGFGVVKLVPKQNKTEEIKGDQKGESDS